MKKTILLSTLALLAACDSNTPAAHHDCDRLNYTPNSPAYKQCVSQMKQAEDMNSQNNVNMK